MPQQRTTVERVCAHCRSSFLMRSGDNQRFCSPACGQQSRLQRYEYTCAFCGTLFTARATKKRALSPQRFCSRSCTGRSKRVQPPIPCARCGRLVDRHPSDVRSLVFCNRLCLTGTPEERFWQYVDRRGEDDCWRWSGGYHHNYGVLTWGGRVIGAHRIALILDGRPPDRHLLVLHKCPGGGNPWCVNPKHLQAGTASENAADKVRSGRQKKSRQPYDVLRRTVAPALPDGERPAVHQTVLA